MVSGPYQSKLLRLAIRQYRKGMERHQRAVRQTQATVVTGALLGGTWALVPLRAAVRWSQQWKSRLNQVAAARVEKLGASSMDQFLQEHSEADDSDTIAQIFSTVLLTVKATLLKSQTMAISGRKASLLRRFAWFRRSRDLQIIGLASDTKTQRIVLILSDASVYDGLDDRQQQRIKGEISKRMGGVAENLPELASSSGLSVVSPAADRVVRSPAESVGIVYSIRAFWVEVLRMVANLRRRQQRQLPLGWRRLRAHQSVGQELLSHESERLAVESCDHRQWIALFGFSAADYSIEADVISSSYVEHPLEKLLNWIDQVLLWLEQRWQSLIDWLQKLS